MAGLRNICKIHGRMLIQGKTWVWDYVADEPVPEKDMREGSKRWKASEKARAEWLSHSVNSNPQS